MQHPTIAIIGGSGLHHLPSFLNIQSYNLDTPFGTPSSTIQVGDISGKKVAFLNRHGNARNYAPNQINYRANIYALKSLGVERIIATSACGSLRQDFAPGDLVIPDQLFDFTKNRTTTFFEDNFLAHINTAFPFCTQFINQIRNATDQTDSICHFGGTLITIEGPRYSTKGESNTFRSWDMSLVGMTTSPEAFLAREAEICYTSIARITDFDVWHPHKDRSTNQDLSDSLISNRTPMEQTLLKLIENFETIPDCECHHALDEAFSSPLNLISDEMLDKYQLLIQKYIEK